ncbi:MAG: GspH/FimT family pseudopilin [Candidatus Zixiibacteriota bacterium]|nr:MAG: GspH/FimT family pseudopilin [candidate division Zixibacteria bacterium]
MIKILKHRFGNRRPERGFTMLEMMIIVVIIGIVAALAAPTFFSAAPRLKARTEARNILNMIRLARSKAISDGAQYGVYLDTAGRQYLLFKDISSPDLMSYDNGDSLVSGPVSFSPELAANSSFTGDVVVFISTGRASQSGNFTFDLTGGGALYTVSILASTGRSKLQ